MDKRKHIIAFVARARSFYRLSRGLTGFNHGLIAAGSAILLWAVAERLGMVAFPRWDLVLAGAVGVALIYGIARAFIPGRSLLAIAAEIDAKAGWKERLSSLLALPAVNDPMEHALEEDVAGVIRDTSPAAYFPARLGRESLAVPLLGALIVAALLLLPSMDLFGTRARQQAQKKKEEEIKKAVEKLKKAKTDLDKPKAKPMDKAADAMKKLDELAQQLQQEAPDKKQTMAEVNKLAEEIKKDRESMENTRSLAEKLQKLAEKAEKEKGDTGELGKKIEQGKFHEAAQELAKIRQKMLAEGLSQEEKQTLADQLQNLKEQFENKERADLEKKLQDPSLSKEEREKLEERLKQLQERMADLKEFAQSMDKAMKGLQDGKEQDLSDLQDALDQLQSELDEMEILEAIEAELEELESELAEGEEGECPS